MDGTPEILLVMPVYNEQASVRKVVTEWFQEVSDWTENFVFLAIDDGSKDGSLKILNRLREQLGPRFEVVSHTNRGHGQTCLAGYRVAIERGIPWIFQLDSDGQCDPQFFFRLWRMREKHDVIYGVRTRRDDGFRRILASFVLRYFLFAVTGAMCRDANVPYRLMRTDVVAKHIHRIGPDFFLANVALSVLLRKDHSVRTGYVQIHFRERYGGEPTVKLSNFGGKAFELRRQLKAIQPAAS